MSKSRVLSLFLALFVSGATMAQFGFHAGPVIRSSNIKVEESGVNVDFKFNSTFGAMAGINYRLPLGTSFAIQPELNWMTKGGKSDNMGLLGEITYNLNYLELPIHFLYTGGNSSGFYAGGGPALNFGLSGKAKFEGESIDVEWGDEEIKRTHVAFNLLAGYRLEGGFDVSAFFSRSITNSAPSSADAEFSGATWSFTNFGLRLGYALGTGEMKAAKVKQVL
jgi:hypothetical protein